MSDEKMIELVAFLGVFFIATLIVFLVRTLMDALRAERQMRLDEWMNREKWND